MSREELQGTTSRRVLIQGMTNTDQIGFWQAPPRAAAAQRQEAEVLPDAGDGADGGGGGDDGEERNEATGLTAAEQAEFDAMRTGGEAPAEGDADAEGEHDDNDEGDAGDDDTNVPEPGPEAAERPDQRQPGQKEPAQQQKTPKTVNYSKYQRELQREKKERETLQQQLQKERDDRIKLNTRLEMINEALQQQAAAPAAQQQEEPKSPFEEEDIDPNEDFAGAISQINRRQRYQLEAQNNVQQAIVETSEDAAIKETFTRDFAAYASKDETLPYAYQHLKDARLTQICLGEFGKDPNNPDEQFTPQEVQRMVQMFNNEEKWLVGKAIKEKRSPAAAIMAMARTFGFDRDATLAAIAEAKKAPQQRQAAPGKVPAREPARQQAPARQQVPAQQMSEIEALEAQLEQLRQNQENGRSLSDGGGAPPASGLTAEMILRLGDEDFAELLDTMPPHKLNELMGRVPQ